MYKDIYGGNGTKKVFSGLDLWDNENPVTDQKGQYSTHLFTNKAENTIRQHDTNKVPKQDIAMFIYFGEPWHLSSISMCIYYVSSCFLCIVSVCFLFVRKMYVDIEY